MYKNYKVQTFQSKHEKMEPCMIHTPNVYLQLNIQFTKNKCLVISNALAQIYSTQEADVIILY